MIDKTKIKNFSIKARVQLREAVEIKLARIGIDSNEIKKELDISTPDKKYYLDESEANSLVGSEITWRQDIVKELEKRGYNDDPKTVLNDFIEEVAYTWFNRIIAIRFMEVNDYLPSRVRVLSSIEGKAEPDIITQAFDVESDLGGYTDEERALINRALLERTPELMDKLYATLFIKQNDELGKILPGLFVRTRDYLKLLFTPSYDRGVIKELVTDLPESYFNVGEEGQVQIIGWMYQYYNTEPKDQSFKKKKYETDDIAPVTQLFTPDWIVKYMVENSLGRYWIDILHSRGDNRTEREIASDFGWQYYLPGSSKNPKRTLDELKNKQVTEIKFIDPAMGSGHILVYAFEVLLGIYESEGYSRREATSLIVKNNLFGLDIDTRAYQLAYFALAMKSREYNRRLFRDTFEAHVYDVPAVDLSVDDFQEEIANSGLDVDKTRADLSELLGLFKFGNDLGSIIKINKKIDLDALEKIAEIRKNNEQLSLLDNKADKQAALRELLDSAELLAKSYDVSVTNPPYMGGGKMDDALKKYVVKNYPESKADLYSVFIEKMLEITKKIGYVGMITMHSWMFLSNFEKLRIKLESNTMINMAHLGTRAFEEIGGEVVQTTSFILKKELIPNYVGSYERLVEYGSQDAKEEKYLQIVRGEDTADLYHTDQSNFSKIPGSPIAYWASENLIRDFENDSFYRYTISDGQNKTGNNKKFVRTFWEVNFDFVGKDKKWLPYAKGGGFRKWYGNIVDIIDWSPKAREFYRKDKIARIIPEYLWYKKGMTWGLITSDVPSFRILPEISTFDVGGSSVFFKTYDNYEYFLGLFNSKVFSTVVKFLNPTLNFQVRDIRSMPIIFGEKPKVIKVVSTNINLSKSDWDAFETSWDFQQNPLIATHIASLPEAYAVWQQQALDRFNQLKANEEELNRIFIDLYGLQDELTPEEDDKEVSVRKADQVRDVKALLSYFVGCVFGRYSLDKPGLAYAGGEWHAENYQSFIPNKNNLLVLTDRKYFDDDRDVIVRLKDFLTQAFSEESLTENLMFIAQTLDPKKYDKGVDSEDIIRQYFLSDFYKDHLKSYQKRPIYWEFNSGKSNGFKALMYLHRYRSDQLAMVRNYLHELQPAKNHLADLNEQLLEQATIGSEKSSYRKVVSQLKKELSEMIKYDSILDNLAQQQIELDLDDGVVVNHKKLDQGKKLLSKI